MGAFAKRAGLVVLLFDLLVGVASAAVLHDSAGLRRSHEMSASRLEQVVEASAPAGVLASCTADR